MKIELAEMKKILSTSQEINSELTKQLNDMSKTLEEICTNVNSSELTASNQKLTSSIVEISNSIKTNLPQIINFLRTQISSYEATNDETKAQIDSLVSAIDNIL